MRAVRRRNEFSPHDNVRMRNPCAVLAIFAALTLGACTPALNWREASSDEGGLKALLPCKPDKGTRDVSLAGEDFEMHMFGCEAENMLFAVSRITVRKDGDLKVVASEWRETTLENLQAKAPKTTPWNLPGSRQWPDATYLEVDAITPTDMPIKMAGAWFSRGNELFHAVIYAPKIEPEVAEQFFSGIKFQ